jgi:hypothetical protein
MIKRRVTVFWKHISDREKLSHYMNIAFGVSLLMITLYFQFGKTAIETPNGIVTLDSGYITEARLWVRIVEGVLSLGLITLGIERIHNRRKGRKCE